jgi:hypothetical protein
MLYFHLEHSAVELGGIETCIGKNLGWEEDLWSAD